MVLVPIGADCALAVMLLSVWSQCHACHVSHSWVAPYCTVLVQDPCSFSFCFMIDPVLPTLSLVDQLTMAIHFRSIPNSSYLVVLLLFGLQCHAMFPNSLWCISCSVITIYPNYTSGPSPPSTSLIPSMCHNVVTLPNGRSAPSSVAAASYRDRGSRTRAHNAAYTCPSRRCAARWTRACRAGAVSAASRGACTASSEVSQCAKEASVLRSVEGSQAGT
jgi:hypothetical protein